MASHASSSHVLITTGRQMHYRLPANSLAGRGYDVTMNTSTPAGRMRGFSPAVHHQFTPQPANAFHAITKIQPPHWLDDADSAFFDWVTAHRLGNAQIVLGAASSSMRTAQAAKSSGRFFVLDRACPDIRVQQDMSDEEARRLGGVFSRSKPWFIDKQLREYELADVIISPSEYSRSSFPEHLKAKAIVAPLLGRAPAIQNAPEHADNEPFTVGVVGGDPLRKGYIYLLEAWKKLAWPNARLLIRSGGDLERYPALTSLLRELPNVEIVGYVPNLSDFYHRCDAFVLPSIDDGFGMALFEAVAHGLPCVATTHCGASELLTNGRDALIVEPYSSDQLAAALERLRSDRAFAQQLAHQGQATVSSLYQDGKAVLYERGMDELLTRLGLPTQIRQ